MLRLTWILAFDLALSCSRAQAVPCQVGACRNPEDLDESSILLQPSRLDDSPHFLIESQPPTGMPKWDDLRGGPRDDWRSGELDRIATRRAALQRGI